jgi:hypothetical protein
MPKPPPPAPNPTRLAAEADTLRDLLDSLAKTAPACLP